MPARWIPYVKVLVHFVCLVPFLGIVWQYRSGWLAAQADPILWLTHVTGDWALWLLLVSLAVTPLRRLHARLSTLIRFRRMLGLYAFFYASLHLATYVFLFSGYDLQMAWAGVKHGRVGEIWQQWVAIWPSVLDDLRKRRFVQVGLFAWTVLLVLTLTSPTWVLRKMGGKTWQRVHRWVYAAAAAACVHYWWLVKAGVRKPLPDTLVLSGLLGARVVWEVMKRAKVGRRVSSASVGG